MIDVIILIKLISAHLVGDFIFQSDKMCSNKNSVILKTRLQWIGLHSLIQGFFTYIFLADWNNWEIPILIIITHYLIDFIKIKTNSHGFIAFVWDQLSHYLVILLIWWGFYIIGPFYYGIDNYVFSLKTWIIFSSFIAILTPTAIFIKLFLNFENWTPVGENFKGLPNAGNGLDFWKEF